MPTPLNGPVVQSAVNISEGRCEPVMRAIAAAAQGCPGAVLADCSSDPDHNRMVATLLGRPDAVVDAVMACARLAVEHIDMREHEGAHPRVGAVDVIPLVPIREVPLEDCLDLAMALGRRLGDELALPVYLYERSARPGRSAGLPEIRRGGFESLATRAAGGVCTPDLGPRVPHSTAGAVVVGVRDPLVAANLVLDQRDPRIAAGIAADIRRDRVDHPGLQGVRALGLALPSRGVSQVSLNLTLPSQTPLPHVFGYVRKEASARGAAVTQTEVVGLLPLACLAGASPSAIGWSSHRPAQIIDNWL